MLSLPQIGVWQITVIELTRKDICSALGVSEHRVRAWMQREPYKSRVTAERKARVFDTDDLLLLAVAQTLEDTYKLRGESLDDLLPALNAYLHRPQFEIDQLVFINMSTWKVEKISSVKQLGVGLIIDLQADKERVARFLGLSPAQAELNLGLSLMRQAKR